MNKNNKKPHCCECGQPLEPLPQGGLYCPDCEPSKPLDTTIEYTADITIESYNLPRSPVGKFITRKQWREGDGP